MRPLFPLLLIFGAHSASVSAAELLPIKINGLEKDKALEQVVRRAVALPEAQGKGETVSEGRLGYYVSNINRLVEDSLEPLGYYHPIINSRLERDGSRAQIIVDVVPGEPVKVKLAKPAVEKPVTAPKAVVTENAKDSGGYSLKGG